MVEALDEGFAQLTLDEVGPRLTAADMVWGPLNYPRDTAEDPLAIAAGCFVEVTDADGVTFRQPASPARFPGADDGPKRPAPKLGQHTREVLAQAGYSKAEIETLIAEGARPSRPSPRSARLQPQAYQAHIASSVASAAICTRRPGAMPATKAATAIGITAAF